MSELKKGERFLVPIAKKKKIFEVVEKDGKLVGYNKDFGYISLKQVKHIERI
jgi:hypothetical protein